MVRDGPAPRTRKLPAKKERKESFLWFARGNTDWRRRLYRRIYYLLRFSLFVLVVTSEYASRMYFNPVSQTLLHTGCPIHKMLIRFEDSIRSTCRIRRNERKEKKQKQSDLEFQDASFKIESLLRSFFTNLARTIFYILHKYEVSKC